MLTSVDRPWLPSALDRRRFLKQTTFGMAALALGGCLPGGTTGTENVSPDISRQLRFASPTEFLILQAAAEQLIDLPSSGGAMTSEDLALRMDRYLSGADSEVQDQFHQLLSVFNSGIVAALFDLRFSTFLGMSLPDRASYLRDWLESPIAFRRTAFMALKRVTTSSYYSHPASWPAIGYDADHASRVAS